SGLPHLLLVCHCPLRDLHSFPTRRSSDLLAGRLDLRGLPIVTIDGENARDFDDAVLVEPAGQGFRLTVAVADVAHYVPAGSPGLDRKSTRLNSSHVAISYAVFCLKKKKVN